MYSLNSATLYTEVSIPECIISPKPAVYQWKTNNPKVKFNFSAMSSPYFHISEFPIVKERVKLEVHVFLGNRTTHASITSFNLYPLLSDKINQISNDISIISIGRESGELHLTSSALKILKNKGISCQWSCHYSDSQQPCVLYSNLKKLLISKEIQNKPHLTLNSEMFQLTEHRFGLHVFTNETKNAFYNTYTVVTVYDGNAPQVLMGSVYINGKHKLNKDISSKATLVPSHTKLVVKGIVRNLELFYSIEWFLSNSVFQLQWNNMFVNNEIHTELQLNKGLIEFNLF